MVDGTARGFGAGAGNAQMEVLVAVLHRMGYQTGINQESYFAAADLAEKLFVLVHPRITTLGIVSGLAGVFSGFVKHVESAAKEYDVNPHSLLYELGRRKIVAGQEDIIIEVALQQAAERRA